MESEKLLEEALKGIPFNSPSEAETSCKIAPPKCTSGVFEPLQCWGAHCRSQFLSFLSLGFFVHQTGEICVLPPLYDC